MVCAYTSLLQEAVQHNAPLYMILYFRIDYIGLRLYTILYFLHVQGKHLIKESQSNNSTLDGDRLPIRVFVGLADLRDIIAAFVWLAGFTDVADFDSIEE